jgi:hypothetical protein
MSPSWVKLGGQGYFLSAENPSATSEQLALEETAKRLMKRPELQRARSIVSILWRNAAAWPARDQMDLFEAAVDEFVFYCVMRAANSDANYPKILRFMEPPSRWFGYDLPGSRWGGSSPNFAYRCIPLAHGARYEIQGRATCEKPPSVTYALTTTSATPSTPETLDSSQMEFDADGGFEITVDDQPANGRKNHIQTRALECFLQIRDALGDWLTQTPNALRVTRLDPPTRAPLGDDEMAAHAARLAQEGFYYAYYCTQSGSGQAPNVFRAPVSSGAFGGMATQWGTKGNLELEEADALIITANTAGAGFRDVTLCSVFFTSLDFWTRTSSFSMAQMEADVDGRVTYVIAHTDPGINNWLDTGGRKRLIFGQRWQAFGPGGPTEIPAFSSRIVKFAELERELPPGVARIGSAGRAAQLASRAAGFRRRFIEA